jgi:hypothetical protein
VKKKLEDVDEKVQQGFKRTQSGLDCLLGGMTEIVTLE